MSCLLWCIVVYNDNTSWGSSLEYSDFLAESESSSISSSKRTLSQGEFSNFVGLSCEIGLLTVIDWNVSPRPSAELDLHLIISSTITNEIKDLEIVSVDCWLLSFICNWCVEKVLTSSLNSAFTCILRNLEFVSPSVEIYKFSWFLKLVDLFSDDFDILLSLLCKLPHVINNYHFFIRVLFNLFSSSKHQELVAISLCDQSNFSQFGDSTLLIRVIVKKSIKS